MPHGITVQILGREFEEVEAIRLGHSVPYEDTNFRVTFVRKDGIRVWLDRGRSEQEQILDWIRIWGSREQLFQAFAIIRGAQLAYRYAKNYGKSEDVESLDKMVHPLLKAIYDSTREKSELIASN